MASKEKIMLLFLPTEAQIHKILSLKNGSPNTKFYNEEEDGYGIAPWNLNGWQNSKNNDIFYFFKTKKSSTGRGICRESKVKDCYWHNTSMKSICNGEAWKTVLSFRAKAGTGKEFQKGWIIHEYKLKECNVGSDWVLCRVFKNDKKKSTIPMTRRQVKRKLHEIEDHVMAEEEEHVLPDHHVARCDEIYADLQRVVIPD